MAIKERWFMGRVSFTVKEEKGCRKSGHKKGGSWSGFHLQ